MLGANIQSTFKTTFPLLQPHYISNVLIPLSITTSLIDHGSKRCPICLGCIFSSQRCPKPSRGVGHVIHRTTRSLTRHSYQGMLCSLNSQEIRDIKSILQKVTLQCDILGRLPLDLVCLVVRYLDVRDIFLQRRVRRALLRGQM